MRVVVYGVMAALVALAGCHRHEAAEVVERNYEQRADAIDRTASAQPNAAAREIYRDRADAIRQEGEERARGLKAAGADKVPPIPAHDGR